MRHHRQRASSNLNKWILLAFAIGLILIGAVAIYFSRWDLGYLIFGLTAGYFADPIRKAVESECISYTTEIEPTLYNLSSLNHVGYSPFNRVSPRTDQAIENPDPYHGFSEETFNPTIPVSPNRTSGEIPFIPPAEGKLPPNTRSALLQKTNNPVTNGHCNHCNYTHPLLQQFPYDPRFHYQECSIPELRSIVDQVILCPRKLLEVNFQETEQ